MFTISACRFANNGVGTMKFSFREPKKKNLGVTGGQKIGTRYMRCMSQFFPFFFFFFCIIAAATEIHIRLTVKLS